MYICIFDAYRRQLIEEKEEEATAAEKNQLNVILLALNMDEGPIFLDF